MAVGIELERLVVDAETHDLGHALSSGPSLVQGDQAGVVYSPLPGVIRRW